MFRPGLRLARPLLRTPITPVRRLQLSAKSRAVIGNYGFVVNILAGGYIGGLLVCFASFYFMYSDANSRQHIPFELSFNDQINAVKAINKDDVLLSPRYAVKHYRRLLIDFAKEVDPTIEVPDGTFEVPIIPASVLVYEKSNNFANFYVDIVMRYAKALLAKGKLEPGIKMLLEIVDNDEIFYKLGNVERLAECCRLLHKMAGDNYLARAIDLISRTDPRVKIDNHCIIAENSRLTDELILVLNDIAFSMAKLGSYADSLNVYLSTLKALTHVGEMVDEDSFTQVQYPFFNCDKTNITVLSNEIRSHVAEVLWAMGHKKTSVVWNEEVVELMYFQHGSSKKVTVMLVNVLTNLIRQYKQMGNMTSVKRCQSLLEHIDVVNIETPDLDWYDNFIKRFSKIMYQRGPLGIIEKPLRERFGKPEPLPELEQMEEEDVE